MRKIELAKNPSRKYLVKKLDDLWRRIIFARDKNQCQWNCGKKDKLAPHHIKPKGKYTRMRWDTDNGITLCYQHHLGNGGAHLDGTTFTEWFKEKFPDRYLYLKRRSQIIDRSKIDYKIIEVYLKSELKKYSNAN